MLYIVDASNGSGKTAYIVYHLLKHYYVDVEGIYEQVRPFRLVSNIDGLKLSHISLENELDDLVDSCANIKTREDAVNIYFTKDYQKELFEIYGEIIYMIDEAQMIFPGNFKNYKVFNWFEYHRHYGQTIYLTTQNKNKLCKDILGCVEYVIRAAQQHARIHKNSFVYRFISPEGKDVVGSTTCFITQKVFDQYTSSHLDSGEKPNPFLRNKILLLVIFCPLIGMVPAYYFYKSMAEKINPKSKEISIEYSSEIPKYNHSKNLNNKINSPVSSNSYSKDNLKDNLNEENIEIEYERKKISYFVYYPGRKKPGILKLIYKGVYTAAAFPFRYEFIGSDCFAFLPLENNKDSSFGSPSTKITDSSGPLFITVGG